MASRKEYIDLFTLDVRENPGAYKASVRADPWAAAATIIEDLSDREISRLTRDLRIERRQVEKLTRR